MAACGSLRSLFENPLPAENPTLIESLSWNQIKHKKQMEKPSFTEIFGELHFQEKPEPPANPTPVAASPSALDHSPPRSDEKKSESLDSLLGVPKSHYRCDSKSSGGFSPKSSESLQLCTEGLGSESSDEVEDLLQEIGEELISHHDEEKGDAELPDSGASWCPRSHSDVRSRSGGGFPPPISSIGRMGKPWVCLKSYREDGRFVLREIRIPTQEFLHASREDGRLRLQFVLPDETIPEGEEEEEQEGEEGGEEKEAVAACDGH